MCARTRAGPGHRQTLALSSSSASLSARHPSSQGHYGDARERLVFNSRRRSGGRKNKGSKGNTGAVYLRPLLLSLYTGTISSNTLAKRPSGQGPGHLPRRDRQLCLGGTSLSVPRLSPYPLALELRHPDPHTGSLSLLLPGELPTSPAPAALSFSVPNAVPNPPLPPS